MSGKHDATPMVPRADGGLRGRMLRALAGAAVRGSLVFSPRPAALLIRRLFAVGGAQLAETLDRHAPRHGITVLKDERYGDDMLMDVARPSLMARPLPLLVWVHGGGWVGGSKDELTGYFKILASDGYVVAAPSYSPAPEHRYPTPLRQVMLALRHLQDNAERYGLDPARIGIGGDSAGAQIGAQIAALVTTPGYADVVCVEPTITAAQLRCQVLACGAYDIKLAEQASSPAGRRFIKAVTWAYTGKRHFATDPDAAAWSVTDNVTRAYPPALITAGNADPLLPHSEALARKLRALGVEADAVFYAPDHRPPLGHEYQFDLDLPQAQRFLERTRAFLDRHLRAGSGS